MCFPNRIDGEQAIYKSLKPFSLSFAKRESNRITNSAFRLSAMKPKPKLLYQPIRGEEIISKNRYDFKVKTSKLHKSREHASVLAGLGEVRCKSCTRGMYNAIEGGGGRMGEFSRFITATVTRGLRRENTSA